MTDIKTVRAAVNDVLEVDSWTTTEAPFGTSYRTWRHDSDRWAVVLCIKGEMAGRVRATELDERYGNVQRFDADRDWFVCDPDDLWLRLWESGVPDLLYLDVEAVTAA